MRDAILKEMVCDSHDIWSKTKKKQKKESAKNRQKKGHMTYLIRVE